MFQHIGQDDGVDATVRDALVLEHQIFKFSAQHLVKIVRGNICGGAIGFDADGAAGRVKFFYMCAEIA